MDTWPRVKELFHSALERDPAERAAFLNASRGDEDAVRAEVQRLLDAHARTGRFIEQSPVAMAGRVVGHYKIERLIGAGGMGEVYLARDVELGRAVAVKIALGTDADAHARLKREAQHASRLNHPNICTIYEVGTSDSQPFIVMEFVEGRRLSDMIPSGGLPIEDVRRYGMQIADALAHAHRNGVTHRDLKAANIVVTVDRRAKVLDFGLARRLSAENLKEVSQSRESVTAEGMIAGTLSCMAPELFRGAPADARSDIWALGVLLYEMTTGKRPFDGVTGFELSGAILHKPPAPLPESVPASARTIIMRCLEKDPAARYQNADDVQLAFEGAPPDVSPRSASPLPLAAARPSFLSRCWRHRIAWMVAIVLAFAAFRVYRLSHDAPLAVGASGRPAVAVMHFENAGGEDAQWLSQGIPNMLLTGLAQTRGLDIVSTQRLREAATQQGVKNLASIDESVAADVARRAGAGAIVKGSIYKANAEIRIDARVEDLTSGRILVAQSVRGTDVFALVDQLAERIRGGVGLPDDPAIRRVSDVSTSSVAAFRLFTQGAEAFINARANDARTALEEAVRIDPTFAEAYLQLAVVANLSGQHGLRREYLRKAAENAGRLSEPRRLLLNVQLARDAGNVQETSRVLDELIAKFPETELAYVTALNFYGGDLRVRDKLLQTMKVGISALPNSTSIRNSYGYALIEVGQYAEGIRQFEKYVELTPREANAYDSLAEGYLASGSSEKAVEFYSRALAIDPAFREARVGLAWSLAVAGRYDEAIDAKPMLKWEEGYIASRLGRYRDAATLLEMASQEAEQNQNIAEQSVHLLTSGALALERKDYPLALRAAAAAEKIIAADTVIRRNRHRVAMHLLNGLAEIGTGRTEAARSRLPLVRQLYRPTVAEEKFWYHTLEGEIALARGDLEGASAAFSASEPTERKLMRWQGGTPTVLANSFAFRDGAARVAKARGDLPAAVQVYRRLLAFDAGSKFIGLFEPRYVLEIARLLERTGDKKSALVEYERFLELWKNADAGLPELAEARRAVTRLSRGTGD